MIPEPTLELITVDTLLEKVRAQRERGCRLVQISATRLPDQVEVTYSFDLNNALSNLRLSLPAAQPRLPSICSIYGCVILYENELHDLFNVQVEGMAVDFKGNFYKTAVKFPFGAVTAPAAKPATSAPATAAKPVPAPAKTTPSAATPVTPAK
jgi:ech hydrogenase subunit D